MKPVVALCLLALAAACARPAASPPPATVEWQLESLGGAPVAVPFAIGLGRQDYVAQGPCGTYAGPLTRGNGPALRFGAASEPPRSSCPAAGAEAQVLGLLTRVTTQSVPFAGARLDLRTAEGTTMRFRPVTPGP